MSNKLIIVESPTKVHTIKKFLGNGYTVIASQGHVRDLPKSELGVNVDNDFEPRYITIRGKGEIMKELKKQVKKADKVYLATDPDREGEAISWHLMSALKLSDKEVHRITFNEITKDAVKNALKNPTKVDENLVDAQQARRILDRVVGYELSPILWKKVKGKLSAGRVQSAVLRMIADRENEINEFEKEEYWSLTGSFARSGKAALIADFYGENGNKMTLTSKTEVEKIEKALQKETFRVTEIKKGTRTKNPPLPFTTSSLQQDAANRLNFSPQRTMRLAQELYEGVKVTGKGTIGLITYLRTDSTRIAKEADVACKSFIKTNYGDNFVGNGTVRNKDNAQDAHEAIRPTDVTLTPEMLKNDLSRDLLRLYQLIWKRFVGSRMTPAVYDTTQVHLQGGKYAFTQSASKLSFTGCLSVYNEPEEKEGKKILLDLKENDVLTLTDTEAEQHFTQPPAHYTEATLVRAMEEKGLGRPSTYAPTIANITSRHYITKERKNLYITELGEVVNNIMMNSFPEIVDLDFTANMENRLDAVSEGDENWKQLLRDFYPPFKKELLKAEEELEHVTVEDEKTDIICEKCGRTMVIKYGPHGKFLACPGFPECRNTQTFLEKIGIACPKCGKDLVVRRTKKGRRFYGCEAAPECDFMSWTKPKK